MALTLSTVVDILADHVVWYGSKCGAVANAPVQKFDVRGGDDAVRTRGNGHTFRRWRYSEYSPTAAASPLQPLNALTCMIRRPTPDRSRFYSSPPSVVRYLRLVLVCVCVPTLYT
jgi:hypothetical protein